MTQKEADLAGPGIGSYEEIEKILPDAYRSLLSRKETQQAIFKAKNYIEENLCRELNLMMVTVPLIVAADSGVNDMLDRDGTRTPVGFHIANDYGKNPIEAEVVQAATKWKRMALKQFGLNPGEGLCTDMRAVRKDYFLDHDHSAYVDQWDWELAIIPEQRRLDFLKSIVEKIWQVIKGADDFLQDLFPSLKAGPYPPLPDQLTFIHAEDLLARYPDLPRKQRETAILQEYPALFIYGIGWTLEDGYPHELRAPDYDDWVTETRSEEGKLRHGLNGDILVWNPVTKRRHELMSGGIRVNGSTLRKQL
ncbi:MAG: aspartate--ammonia ligase, partial [Deltaproteobacteria bacterium]|nr:aspartate--ammonia ligase [Deltaproteobacteria bacterium]